MEKNKNNTIPLAVDFHLPSGTLWADKNVGAELESDAGDFFAWGETEPKELYNLDTYKFWKQVEVGEHEETETEETQATDDEGNLLFDEDGNPIIEGKESSRIVKDYEWRWTKYCFEDGKQKLEPEDDAATAILGEGWSTPSKAQFAELFEYCGKTIEDDGIRFTREGKSIFLPFCGYKQEDVVYNLSGMFATDDRCDTDESCGWRAVVNAMQGKASSYTDHLWRVIGTPVRAVKNNNTNN